MVDHWDINVLFFHVYFVNGMLMTRTTLSWIV